MLRRAEAFRLEAPHALKVAREGARSRSPTLTVAADHGLGRDPILRVGAAQASGRNQAKVRSNARHCFQQGPTQLLKGSWATKSDANGRTIRGVELINPATVVAARWPRWWLLAGHGGGWRWWPR